VSHHTVYAWRDDVEFAQAESTTRDAFADMLEIEAVRRAHGGVLKPVFQGGLFVGHVREYSDTLLIFLLNAARPLKYRANSKIDVAIGGTLTVRQDRLATLSDEDLRRIAEASA
jgi:hypothetical protein